MHQKPHDDIRYDTIEEFNVDSKAEYSALSGTRSQKKKLKQTNASAPLIVIQYRLVTVRILHFPGQAEEIGLVGQHQLTSEMVILACKGEEHGQPCDRLQ